MAKTAEEYRELAKASRKRREESWQRSDTDGFLSQWASDITARLYDRKAEIVDAGGKDRFCGLWQDQRRVAAKIINTKYGSSWLLRDDEAERFGRRFVPTGLRSRIQKQLGLHEADEMAPAWAKLMGEGTGLSGCASAYVGSFRTGCKWGTDAEYVEPQAERAKREGWE